MGDFKRFQLIAHRGLSAEAPENTVAAFDLAITHGFRHLELDVRLSSDGVPVVIHDEHLSRTTDGKGCVSRATWHELQALDAGSWFSAEYAGERIPALDCVLARYSRRAHLHVELKSQEPELAAKVSKLVHAHDWAHLVTPRLETTPGLTITSVHLEQLKRSLKLLEQVRHGWLVRRVTPLVLDRAIQSKLIGIYPSAKAAHPGDIALAQQIGCEVRTWGVKNLQDLERSIRAGASGCTVDWVREAHAYLESRNA